MDFCDANLLLNVLLQKQRDHALCKSWLQEAFKEKRPLAVSSAVLCAVVRVSTNVRKIIDGPDLAAALDFADWFRSQRSVAVIEPGAYYPRLFRECCLAADASGNLVSDAHLAALAMEHNARVVTMDKDFKRFPKLKVLHLKP